MSEVPYMKLYVSDYIADTTHLKVEEHGTYLLLLFHMWKSGGSLEFDFNKLRRICGLTPAKWRRIWPEIQGYFTIEKNQVFQKRLQKEYENSVKKRTKNKLSGAQGGRAKSLKNNNPGLANATETLGEYYSHSYSHSQNNKPLQGKADSEVVGSRGPEPDEDWPPLTALDGGKS